MIKKRIIKTSTFILIALLLNAFVINYAEINISPKLSLEVSGEEQDEFQIFYDQNFLIFLPSIVQTLVPAHTQPTRYIQEKV